LRRTISVWKWLPALLLAASGCAGEEVPRTYPVQGKVILKNGTPLAGGAIVFTSVADPELRGYGTIAKDGTFMLDTIALTRNARGQRLHGAVEGAFSVNIRPDGGAGGPREGAFTLKKTYRVEAKENNEITVVVE